MMHWWNLSRQQNTWMMYPYGDKEIIDFTPLFMVILSIEVDVEEDENGFRKDRWRDLMEDSEEDTPREIEQKHSKQQQIDHNQIGKKKIGLYLPMQREGKMRQRGMR